MKKTYVLIGASVALAGAISLLCFFLTLWFAHWAIIDGSHEYETVSLLSSDEKYRLETDKYVEESGVYASFTIVSQDTLETVFECPDRYRTMDLKGIHWDGDTYNVIVESGDVGTILYPCENGSWKKP